MTPIAGSSKAAIRYNICAIFRNLGVAKLSIRSKLYLMKTILAPIDFSRITNAVVDEAVTLAKAVDGRVVLLAVIQPPVVMSEYAAMMDIAELTAAGERNAARQLEQMEKTIKPRSVNTECVQVVGSPVTHIVEQAAKFEADYIVMGSHGHTAFYDLLVGSTTHGVLKRAQCPVVIVPAAREATGEVRRSARRAAVA
jgi:nucleotide-binding universal stress UspA family protein